MVGDERKNHRRVQKAKWAKEKRAKDKEFKELFERIDAKIERLEKAVEFLVRKVGDIASSGKVPSSDQPSRFGEPY